VSATETDPTPTAAAEGKRPERSLVIVAGSGRSGTSLVSGLLKRLGCRVPTPEVPADETNPKGFAESQWVVDLHERLLAMVNVQVSDARPAAWAKTAKVCLNSNVQSEVRAFLEKQFEKSNDVIIKDPRMSWFLPVWRRAAQDLGATPRVIVMLRHPAAVVASKEKYYGGRQGEASRTAGWVNQLLFTERATRDAPRVFLRYENLLEDWTVALSSAAQVLDLTVVRDAPANNIRSAHDFVDITLDRSKPTWGTVPAPLVQRAEDVWEQVNRLAETPDAPPADVATRMDELRATYTEYYTEAESVAWSSVAAARTKAASGGKPPAPRPSLPPATRKVLRRVPKRVRHLVPRKLRKRLVRSVVARRNARRAKRAAAQA
jgi:hypothetical protein